MSRRPPLNVAAFRHYMRVRIGGAGGPLGRLLKCRKRDGSGHYWKVKLDAGGWEWPDRMVLDGPGTDVVRCVECDLPTLGSGLCRYCDERMYGTEQRANEPPEDPVARRNWIRRREEVRRKDAIQQDLEERSSS